jgi:asparagine synthase (glutamine-hydrolysing)
MAHGFLIAMAKEKGVKVVLGGQGADEVFFGYENMVASLLSNGIRKGHWGWVKKNLQQRPVSLSAFIRLVAGGLFPSLEKWAREKSRRKKRAFITRKLQGKADDQLVKLARASDFYEVWTESVYGVHLPHLLHYDDRNSMSYSMEGRMPFLDHRIVEHVAKIKACDFFVNGESKNLLRRACADLLPDQVLKRKDKIGFYTPLHDMLKQDIVWIENILTSFKAMDKFIVPEVWKSDVVFFKGNEKSIERSLRLWRVLSFVVWMKAFQIDTHEF